MTREELDFIGSLNMHDEISNDAYKKIVCHCEEQEPCEDCISKAPVKKAIDEMLEWIESDNRNSCDYFIVDKIEEIIKELSIDTLPSVQPKAEQEPKTGHWTRELIRNDKGGCIGAKMICSECGQDNGYDRRMKFCPNCGAKMEE